MTAGRSDPSPPVPHGALHLSGRALLPGGPCDAAVIVADGAVSWAGPRGDAPRVPATVRRCTLPDDALLVPGFVDLHVHGARGADAAEGRDEALATIAAGHAAYGTTACCPTVIAGPVEQMLAALEAVARAARRAPRGARILGAHLEGPFLNPTHAGAQAAEHLRAPDEGLLEELIAAAAGTLRVVTLAPELSGALRLVERLCELGVVVSMGHSAASFEEAGRAIDAGCRLATHACNAMPALHHRAPGLLGAILDSERVVAEVIADGVHLAPAMLRLLRRLKGDGQLALVTDCSAALDAPAGRARLGERAVSARGGASRFADGSLAGSVLTMDRAVRNQIALGGAPLAEAIACASAVPAGVLGREGLGALVPGAAADLVVLDATGRVSAVLVGGAVVAGTL